MAPRVRGRRDAFDDGDGPVEVQITGVHEAALDASPPTLRPGMEGVGKIVAGQRRLLWIWTHRAVDHVRLKLWEWWP